MRKDLVSEINITSKSDCLIWQYPVDEQSFARTVKLNVGTGCQAVIYINGQPSQIYEAGLNTIAWKKATQKGNKINIVGINKDKQFKILFGIGGVPFNDRETKQSVLVGIHGECSCRVADGKKLYLTYGEAREKVTDEYVTDDLRAKLQEKLTTELSKKMSEFNYISLFTSVEKISDVIKEQYAEVLHNAGIELLVCSISKPHFPEGYDESRAEAIRNRTDSLYASKQTSDDELLKTIMQHKQVKQEEPVSKVTVCQHCKKENDLDAKFCKFCGRKLNK